jgi:hypothetical protein
MYIKSGELEWLRREARREIFAHTTETGEEKLGMKMKIRKLTPFLSRKYNLLGVDGGERERLTGK